MATVVVRHGLDDRRDDQLVVMVVENCQQAELGPMEKAEALGVLREGGPTLTEIARRTDLAAIRVGALLALLELDAPSRERVCARLISATTGIDAVRDVRVASRDGTPVKA